VQVVFRRWPVEPAWVPMLAMVAAAVLVAVAGSWRARPSMAEVARLADVRLGGRERLFTALELAQGGGGLSLLQQADAEAWAASADPRQVSRRRLPRRALGIAVAGIALTAGLALVPNGALDRLRAARADEALREAGAEEIASIATEVARAGAGSETPKRRALVRELRTAEMALRAAPTNAAAVAALSRTQAGLRALVQPTGTGAGDAAAAAGDQLARTAASEGAGKALAAAGASSGAGLGQMTAELASAEPGGSAAVASQLAQAAEEAADPSVAEQLRKAAEEAAAGRSEAAQAALDEAERRADQADADRAAEELSSLGRSLPGLSAAEQAELAEALSKASVAAGAQPELAQTLANAATALAEEGQMGEAAAALEAAAGVARGLGAAGDLDTDAARANDGLQSIKDALLAKSEGAGAGSGQGCGEGQADESASAMDHAGRHGLNRDVFGGGASVQTTPRSLPQRQAEACPEFESPSGDGLGQGVTVGPGAGGFGSQGSGEGGGPGQAQGPGSGQGGAEGHRGGGGIGGGAEGRLAGRPGAPTERVYVPGGGGTGRSQALPSGTGDQGADASLVPYEQVYAEYRADALTQTDRQLMPERLRGLLRDYFDGDNQ